MTVTIATKITCRNTITIKEVTIVAGTDFLIMPIINDHRDSTIHIITVVIAIGIHVRSIDG